LNSLHNITDRLLATGQFLILLDGYDELYSDKLRKVTNDLDRFIDRYSKNHYIISSRPGSGTESMSRFKNHYVEPMKDSEIPEYINRVLDRQIPEERLLAMKIKFAIRQPSSVNYKQYLSTPLLLSMFILTF
jgi:predicted NACHT family NTPase